MLEKILKKSENIERNLASVRGDWISDYLTSIIYERLYFQQSIINPESTLLALFQILL